MRRSYIRNPVSKNSVHTAHSLNRAQLHTSMTNTACLVEMPEANVYLQPPAPAQNDVARPLNRSANRSRQSSSDEDGSEPLDDR